MKLKNRFNGTVIYEDSEKTIKATVINAVKSGANLSRADLTFITMTEKPLSREAMTDREKIAEIMGYEVGLAECQQEIAQLRELVREAMGFIGCGDDRETREWSAKAEKALEGKHGND